jgi:hypothetical protein
MHHIKLIAVVILSSVSLLAQSASKTDLIGDIMKAYGVESSIETTKSELLKQADAALKGVIDQLKAARPNLSSAASEKIKTAMDKYINTVMNSWNGVEVVKVYSKIYEDNYSLEELQALASYVKTDDGSKSIKIAQSAGKAINAYVMERMMSSMKTALKVFMEEVQTIVREDQSQDKKK